MGGKKVPLSSPGGSPGSSGGSNGPPKVPQKSPPHHLLAPKETQGPLRAALGGSKAPLRGPFAPQKPVGDPLLIQKWHPKGPVLSFRRPFPRKVRPKTYPQNKSRPLAPQAPINTQTRPYTQEPKNKATQGPSTNKTLNTARRNTRKRLNPPPVCGGSGVPDTWTYTL